MKKSRYSYCNGTFLFISSLNYYLPEKVVFDVKSSVSRLADFSKPEFTMGK